MTELVLARKKPVGWSTASISSRSAPARASAVGQRANSVGVTVLTMTSVVWADSTVATSSCERGLEVELAVGVRVALEQRAVDPPGPPGPGDRVTRPRSGRDGRRWGRHGHRVSLRCGSDDPPHAPVAAVRVPDPPACAPPSARPTASLAHCRAWITTSCAEPRCSPPSTTRRPSRSSPTMSPSRLERGDVLFHEGDQGDRLYVIGEGKIKLGRSQQRRPREPPGDPRPRRDVRRAVSLFDPGPRTATATAVAETQLVSMGHDQLKDFLVRPPRRGHDAARRARPPAAPHQRVPRRPRLHRRPRPRRQGAARPRGPVRPPGRRGLLVAHDLTQEELAQLVGASRETVNKALADFASRGWLRLEARAVLLLDVERLRRRAR